MKRTGTSESARRSQGAKATCLRKTNVRPGNLVVKSSWPEGYKIIINAHSTVGSKCRTILTFGGSTIISNSDGWEQLLSTEYFYTLSGVYYFDGYRNVFFHDSTLVHDASDAPDWDDLITPHFYLNEVPFWFDDQGLLYQGTDGNIYRTDVWQNDLSGQSDDGLESLIAGTKALSGLSGAPEASGSIEERQSNVDVFTSDCFRASGRLYYFDSNRRLFSKAGRLVYGGSSSFMARQSILLNFQIDDVGYWFGPYRLSYPPLDQRPISKNRRAVSVLVANPASHGGLNAVPTTISDFDSSFSTTPKDNGCSRTVTADSLQQAFRGDVNITLSPSSEPNVIQHLPVNSESQDRIVQPQIIAEKASAGRKQRGEEHRRCPYCLKEHIYTHTGEKHERYPIHRHSPSLIDQYLTAHVYPFVDCNTGFATRRNMRRHFLTHQVGEIEKYTPCMTQGSVVKKQRKAEVDTLPLNPNDSFIGRIRL
ncbi:hypothetical protein B0J17DRAFT_731819 [Rhizoctonia solani]|nr:hypothetical protein B0J17DRAFT_731819 [Rhizoctonia solani]